MKITAITRFKHGELFAALRQANMSAKKLSDASGIRYESLCEMINLQRKPTEEQANKMQLALGRAGVFLDILSLWPEAFHGLASNQIEQTQDVDESHLLEFAQHQQLLTEGTACFTEEQKDAAQQALDYLPDDDRELIEATVMDGASLSDLGTKEEVTRAAIFLRRDRALLRLRERAKKIQRVQTGDLPQEALNV